MLFLMVTSLSFAGVSMAQAAEIVGVSSGMTGSSSAAFAVQASAPRDVNGYTYHCRDRMAQRSVTESMVQSVVTGTWPSAVYQSVNNTYKYTGSQVVVILSTSGYCVSVWRR